MESRLCIIPPAILSFLEYEHYSLMCLLVWLQIYSHKSSIHLDIINLTKGANTIKGTCRLIYHKDSHSCVFCLISVLAGSTVINHLEARRIDLYIIPTSVLKTCPGRVAHSSLPASTCWVCKFPFSPVGCDLLHLSEYYFHVLFHYNLLYAWFVCVAVVKPEVVSPEDV